MKSTKARAGSVYLVGAGPGDPGLLTRRGAELVASADVVLLDPALDPTALAEVRGAGALAVLAAEADVPAELLGHARAGASVVRLVLGDPLLLGPCAAEARALAAARVPFELVPGVALPAALAAYVGVPLASRAGAAGVLRLAATGGDAGALDYAALAGHAGAVCVALAGPELGAVCGGLAERAGLAPTTPGCVVARLAEPDQATVVAPLAELPARAAAAGLAGPCLLVVGQGVAERDELRWYDRQPLFGRRVLVTRAAHQAGDTAALLRSRGAEPLLFPVIALEPPPEPERVTAAVRELSAYALVAFTSENAVRALFEELDRQDKDARAFGAARVAAIGPGTARALALRGVRPDLMAKDFVAEGLAAVILAAFPGLAATAPPLRALLPRALRAREILPETLARAGFAVDVVPVYQTVSAPTERRAELVRAFERGHVDCVLLTSSSTVTELVDLLGPQAARLLARAKLASIGPVTSATLRERGLEPFVTATESTVPGLVAALERALAAGGA
ncbi:MAG: uroporphyrinogen-III synthase [Polyangiaceae bacterium]|nr:uroporphyrinogen-III synthase [Polyangiaceae bacterium]